VRINLVFYCTLWDFGCPFKICGLLMGFEFYKGLAMMFTGRHVDFAPAL
jgi:hypothetical protein